MSKIVVVFGATGNQGGSVIKSILGDPEAKAQFSIRGVTRDVNSAKAKALKEQGVEPVQADLNDPASILKAFEGAYAAFVVTDYWAHMSYDKEVEQGKAAADAAKKAGLQHYIFSSLLNVKEATKGKFSGVYHFDSKAVVEEYVRSLGIPATFFQPGCYMSNMAGMMRPDDKGVYRVSWPMPGDKPIPMFEAAADSGKFVKAILLHRDELLGRRVHAATAYMTPDEVVAAAREAFPESCAGAYYAQAPRGVFKQILQSTGMPEGGAEDLTEMFEFFGDVGYYNGEPLEPSLALLKEAPTTLGQYYKAEPAFKDLK